MKYVVFIVLCFLTVQTRSFTVLRDFKAIENQIEEILCNESLKIIEIEKQKLEDQIKLDGFNRITFNSKMAELESGKNGYNAINRLGYMGKYQFGVKTLKALKNKSLIEFSDEDIQWNNFKLNHKLQEEAMYALTKDNLLVLTRYGLTKYIGKKIGGVTITIEGMLAASHLRGCYAVKLFILSGGEINQTDANETSVKNYLNKFA